MLHANLFHTNLLMKNSYLIQIPLYSYKNSDRYKKASKSQEYLGSCSHCFSYLLSLFKQTAWLAESLA